MKVFKQPINPLANDVVEKATESQQMYPVKNISVNNSGNLIVELIGNEYQSHIEGFLQAVLSELREDRIKNSFQYTYDDKKKTFIITPIDDSVTKRIMAFFDLNNLVPTDKTELRPSPR